MRGLSRRIIGVENHTIVRHDEATVLFATLLNIISADGSLQIEGLGIPHVINIFIDALEDYCEIAKFRVIRVTGLSRLGVGGSAVAGDVEVDRRCASGYSPFAATVDEGNGRGVFADESMAVTVFFYIVACADCDIALVPFGGIIYISDCKAARKQIIGHRVVSRRCVRAGNCYGAFQQTGVVRIVGVDVEIVIARLLRRGVDNDFNDIVLYQRNGYIAAIVASGDVYLYVLAISCGCKHGDAPHFFMRNVSVGVYFVASNYTTVVNVVIRVARRLPTIGEIIRVGRLIVGSVDLNTNRIKDYVANPILGIILRVILLNDAVEEYIVSIHHVELCSADA